MASTTPQFSSRLAKASDITDLKVIMQASINELQKPFLDDNQIKASWAFMGLDTQLIEDGTYFIIQAGQTIAGCGGWSKRATLYGGDAAQGRSARVLDPQCEAARTRAMYTNPNFTRQGVGSLILNLCEDAARAYGFKHAELMATLAGEPLYRARGYKVLARATDDRGGTSVPLIKMGKALL